MQIEFKNTNPAIDIECVKEFQQKWGIKLPKCYVDFLLKYNGGRPTNNAFPIIGFTDPFGGVQVFFGLKTLTKTSDLNWRIENRIAPFPDGFLEIACTDGNDLLCINTMDSNAPVFFFDHRPSWGNGLWKDTDLYVVAASFSELLSKLQSKKDDMGSSGEGKSATPDAL